MKNILIIFFTSLFLSELLCDSDVVWSSPPDTLSLSTVDASDPQVAIDSQGNVVAAWIENGFVKSSTKINGTWSNSSILSNSGASAPRIVVDTTGNATAIWLESGALKAASMPFGGTWSAVTNLSSAGASSPQIAVDPSGNVVAIWVKNGVIQSATKLYKANWPIFPDTISSVGVDSPQVAIGVDGTVVAVWHSVVASADKIYSASKSVSGVWSVAQIISNAAYHSVYPQIAVDLNGNALAIWFRYSLAGSVYSNVVVQWASRPANTNWTVPADLSGAGIRDPADLKAHVAFDMNGNAIAVWTTSFDGSYFDIQTTIMPVNGNWVMPACLVRDLYSDTVDLAVSPVGDAFIVYTLSSSFLTIHASETDLGSYSTNLWLFPEPLSQEAANAYPRVAASAGSMTNVAAVWVSFNGSNNVIQSVTGTEEFFLPPYNLSVMQNVNDFDVFSEYYNTLSWYPSPNTDAVGYLIYRNGKLLTISSSSALQFIDHNRKLNESVMYGVAAFKQGSQSPTMYTNFPSE